MIRKQGSLVWPKQRVKSKGGGELWWNTWLIMSVGVRRKRTLKNVEFVSESVDYSFGKWCGGQAVTWLFLC